MGCPPDRWLEHRLRQAHARPVEIEFALGTPCPGAPELPGSPRWPGAVIAGGVGSGKTVLALRMLLGVLEAEAFDLHDRDPVELPGTWTCRATLRFESYNGLQAAIRAQSRGDVEPWRGLTQPRLLVIDDLGRNLAPWMAEAFEALVDERCAFRRVTLLTTNLPCGPRANGRLDAFETLYPRAASRLLDARGLGLIVTGARDLRQRAAP